VSGDPDRSVVSEVLAALRATRSTFVFGAALLVVTTMRWPL
jgi:hypothetical protein